MPVRSKIGKLLLMLFVLLVVALAVTLPYLIAARSSGPDYVFSGFLFNPLDGNSYLAKMMLGWRGEWQFRLPYTAEPGPGAYLFLFYIFLGHLARSLGWSLVFTFHAARLAAAALLMLALAQFFAALFPQAGMRLFAIALAILGSGMGWLGVPFGAFTADFWVAEAYPFLSMYANPHFPLGLACLLWLLLPAVRPQASPPARKVNEPILIAALLGISQPFGVVVALVALGVSAAWEAWRGWGRQIWQPATWPRLWALPALHQFAWTLIGGAPFLLYDLWAARANPALAGWNAQNVTPTPAVWDLALAFSPALLLAVAAIRPALKSEQPGERLLLGWALASLALLYLPLGLQRRFMTGLYVPVAGLAVLGAGFLAQRWHRRLSVLVVIVFGLMLPTNLLLLLTGVHAAQVHEPKVYLSRGEAQALEWLQANTPERALVLASPEMGLFIPAHTGRRVLYGHPFETVNAAAEQRAVEVYYAGAADAGFLAARQVDFVFYGPRERDLGPAPAGLPAVFSAGDVSVYAVPR